jgi:hypothetical protein
MKALVPLLAALLFLGAARARAEDGESVEVSETAMQGVVVKPGDTLWSIAHKYLKDPARWDEILKHNRLPTSDPTVALPGMTLRVPLKLIKTSLRAARLVYEVNRVLFRRTDSAEWKGAQLEMELFQGDTLRTLEESKARVKFLDKELLNLDPNSMAVIKPSESDADVELRAGSAFTGHARVVTANARVTPRTADTRYAATVERDLTTRVEVLAGKAGVEAQGKEVEVPAGMQTRVAPGLPPEVPKAIENLSDLEARGREFESAGADGAGAKPARRAEAAAADSASNDEADASKLRGDVDSMSVGVPILGYHIQAAREKDFKKILFDRQYDKDEHFAPSDAGLDPGSYWWRTAIVDLLGTEGPYGQARRYAVKVKSAPRSDKNLEKLLTVLSPVDGAEVNADSVHASGVLHDDRLRLEIGGKPARLDADGNFAMSLPLKPGMNEIEFIVTDGKGGIARVVRRVRRL